ncbi:unnamed protein product [Closterium sp. Naga37s-1]|nr:unnamed protein product [Closterium sp. Naga37s-1]
MRATPEPQIEEDEWWLRDYADEVVEEWRAGDGEEGDAEAGDGRAGGGDADMTTATTVEPTAVAADEDAGEDGDAAADEGDDDDPWRLDEDDVPLYRRHVKHQVDVAARKETRRFTVAEKGKQKVDEGPSRRVKTAPAPTKKKALKKKAPVAAPSEPAECSDDDYAVAAGPIPKYAKKKKPKDLTVRSVVVQAQENGWMDEDAVCQWLRGEILLYLNSIKALDGKENHLVIAHLRARSTSDVSEDMTLAGTSGDNTYFVGRAPEGEGREGEEEEDEEGVEELVGSAAPVEEDPFPNTVRYRGAEALADKLVDPCSVCRT